LRSEEKNEELMRESFKLKTENDEMINEKIGLIQQK